MTVATPERTPGPVMKIALAFQRSVDRISEWAGWLGQWFVVATIVVGLTNTVLRYIGQATSQQLTSNIWVEMQWNLYSMIFLLSFGYILKHGVNVRVDFWYTNRTRKTQARIDLVGHVISLIPFTLIGIWISISGVQFSWAVRERSPNPGGLPFYPIKTMILVALFLLFLQTLAEIVKLAAELRGVTDPRAGHAAPIRIE